MEVMILRGLPGVGKTTYVDRLIKGSPEGFDCRVVSADHYFVQDGKYVFDRSKIKDAHRDCLTRYLYECQTGEAHLLVVDNTNIYSWEIAPYYVLAEAFGYDVHIRTFDVEQTDLILEDLCNRNVHGVQIETLRRMYFDILAPLPSHWSQSVHPAWKESSVC